METSHAASSQYHHFVPQFLLKNFAHPYVPQKAGSPTYISRPNGEPGKKIYHGDLVVNCLNLSSETPEIMETSVKRVLGQMDMYRDTTRPYPEQYTIEKMLANSSLEPVLSSARLRSLSMEPIAAYGLHATNGILSENFSSS
jgi:Protein of unknown function (DUF4238)